MGKRKRLESGVLTDRFRPPETRADSVRRIVLIGAESTGKTTLAKGLANHFGTVWVPEHLREFVEEKNRLPCLADIPEIARTQWEREEARAGAANRFLFCDTNLILTEIYSRYYLGSCPESVIELASRSHYDLYLLTGTEIPWEPDPMQRDGPEVREEIQSFIRRKLEREAIAFLDISGNREERLESAARAIEQLEDNG